MEAADLPNDVVVLPSAWICRLPRNAGAGAARDKVATLSDYQIVVRKQLWCFDKRIEADCQEVFVIDVCDMSARPAREGDNQ
jgi:hypothetical protein